MFIMFHTNDNEHILLSMDGVSNKHLLYCQDVYFHKNKCPLQNFLYLTDWITFIYPKCPMRIVSHICNYRSWFSSHLQKISNNFVLQLNGVPPYSLMAFWVSEEHLPHCQDGYSHKNTSKPQDFLDIPFQWLFWRFVFLTHFLLSLKETKKSPSKLYFNSLMTF